MASPHVSCKERGAPIAIAILGRASPPTKVGARAQSCWQMSDLRLSIAPGERGYTAGRDDGCVRCFLLRATVSPLDRPSTIGQLADLAAFPQSWGFLARLEGPRGGARWPLVRGSGEKCRRQGPLCSPNRVSAGCPGRSTWAGQAPLRAPWRSRAARVRPRRAAVPAGPRPGLRDRRRRSPPSSGSGGRKRKLAGRLRRPARRGFRASG